jgi:hypothetical protein
MTRTGLPSRVMVGAGLAPALAFAPIRLRITFANKVLYGRQWGAWWPFIDEPASQANHGGRP